MRRKQVVVIGGSKVSRQTEKTAYNIGKEIALRNLVLISGGRSGVMKAASQGAKEHNGLVVGILPGTRFDEANNYCDIVIPTGIGYARNLTNILSADLVISVEGSCGTLTELAYAWQYDKKIVACSFTGGWSEKLAGTKIDNKRTDKIIDATDIKTLCEELDSLNESN